MKAVIFTIVLVLSASFLNAQTTFTKITTGPLVTDQFTFNGGICFVDYDNDGDLDLFRANASEDHVLYENNGVGSFTRLTSFLGSASETGFTSSSTWGDYDNDGDLDVFVAIGGGNNVDEKNQLYRNDGDPDGTGQFTFTRITSGAIVNDRGDALACSWGDYDNDGDLDLLVANVITAIALEDNFLYRNNGDPDGTGQVTFTRITSGAIVNDGGGQFALWSDFDGDRDLDVFVGLFANNRWYKNNGSGNFTRIAGGALVDHVWSTIGASSGDYDNDGDLDLFVTSGNDASTSSLYQNNGAGFFTAITTGEIVELVGGSSGASSWGDYDNDGDLDLFVSATINLPAKNHLYENNGDGSFTAITTGPIVNDRGGGSAIWGDYDNDGDLDLFVAVAQGGNLLYRNDGNSNNWINIKCVGTFSNRSAIGTKIKLNAAIKGKQVQQMREISGQTGRRGQNSLNVEFGLADAAIIDTVTIEWPLGIVQVLTGVAVNQFLTITEKVPLRPQHTPLSTAEAGTEIAIAASDSGRNFSELSLLFRRGGEGTFTILAMVDQGNGSFLGTIPAGEVTIRGVEYQIVATDTAGSTVRLPLEGSYSVQVHVSGGISRGQAQPFGSAQTAYRIFSVPLDLDDKSPAALLEDDLGEYDDTRWRFSEFVGNNAYVEFPEISEIVPGKGYWLLVTEPVRIIDTGAGSSNITFPEFIIVLRSGWNLIGNPFNFAIPVTNIHFDDRSPVDLRTFVGADAASWNNPVTNPVTEILPFEGYAVFNEQPSLNALFINADFSVSGLSKKSRNTPVHLRPERRASNDILWAIEISAQCQQARDVDNVAGVSFLASEERDRHDFPEPPPIGEYVSVYFPHPEWNTRSTRYSTDFRPEFAYGSSWEFEVKSNIHDRVQLTFAGIEKVPREFEVWLVDAALNLTQNLRDNPRYAVAGSEEQPKSLKFLVGTSEFIGEKLATVQTIPTDFELSQNFPNPFNPATTIRYRLPREERVMLKIYNIFGAEVVTLVDNELKSSGNHSVVWDSRNASKRAVASGLYFFQMRAGKFVQTRKMLLIE